MTFVITLTFSYHAEDSWCWSVLLDLDHGENLWHLPLTGTGIEQAGRGQEDPVHTAKCGHGHEDGDHERHWSVHHFGKCLKMKK